MIVDYDEVFGVGLHVHNRKVFHDQRSFGNTALEGRRSNEHGIQGVKDAIQYARLQFPFVAQGKERSNL